MNGKVFTLLIFLAWSFGGSAQTKARAIAYRVDVDLEIFAPDYVEQTESEDLECKFEVDLYYTDTLLRTHVRTIKRPDDYNLTIRERMYRLPSKDEYNIDHTSQQVILKRNQVMKPKPTKKQKNILGYACKEYIVRDFRNIEFSMFTAEKLPDNVCPVGNFSVKGTVLEVIASNGLHYLATDFAEGILDSNFFKIPDDYGQQVMDLGVKKSK